MANKQPKFPYYVSKHNGSIHLPQVNSPGYEDRQNVLFVGAVTIQEAQRLGASITERRKEEAKNEEVETAPEAIQQTAPVQPQVSAAVPPPMAPLVQDSPVVAPPAFPMDSLE